MKIKIFVLGTEGSVKDDLFDTVLRKSFSEQLENDTAIEYYASVKDATSSIGEAFSAAQMVMFFAAPANYGAVKKIIARAFGIKLSKNTSALEKALHFASDQIKSDGHFEENHVLLPEKGKAFIPSDGLFSGFASVRGQQSVVFLPYAADRAAELLAAQVIPFINSVYALSIPTEYADHMYAYPLHDLLDEETVNIALALTKTSDLFCDYISTSPVLRNCIEKTPRSEERGNMRPSEYVVNLSIAAAELQGAPYGIVMSNAYYMDENSKDRLTVFMAVTNDQQTTVREVKSYAWESASEFMKRCCAELCKLLADIIFKDRGGDAVGTPDDPKKIQKYRTLIAIVGAAAILIAVAGFWIFSSNSYSLKDWMHNHFPAIFSQQTISEDEADLYMTDDYTDEATDPTADTASAQTDASETEENTVGETEDSENEDTSDEEEETDEEDDGGALG